MTNDDADEEVVINLMSSEGGEPLDMEEEKEERSKEVMTWELKRKRDPEEEPDERDHEVKRRKEFDSWNDLEDLMKARVPRENSGRFEKGEPSDHFIEIWEEIWDGELERRHKMNF